MTATNGRLAGRTYQKAWELLASALIGAEADDTEQDRVTAVKPGENHSAAGVRGSPANPAETNQL